MVLVALAITLAQLLFALSATDSELPLRGRYESLVQHDSYWFLNIIQRGYSSPVPPSPKKDMDVSNVAFFPAYPTVGGVFIHKLGMPPKIGLLVAAQLGTCVFWFYLQLLLRRFGFGPVATAGTMLAIAAHPAAFFLVAGYSESLFLAALTGFVYFSSRPGGGAHPVLAAAHGFVATATRIAGVPAVLYPVVNACVSAWDRCAPETAMPDGARRTGLRAARAAQEVFRAHRTALLVSAVAVLGAVSFFLYCQFRFGSWDFYMQTQQAGWRVKADYLALFKPRAYARYWPDNWHQAWQIGQSLVPFTVAAFLAVAVVEMRAARRATTRWRQRVGLHFVAFSLFYIAVSGVFSVRLESMIRYQFCAFVFFAVAVVHAVRDPAITGLPSRPVLIALLLLAAAGSLYLQSNYTAQFTRGGWVA